MGTMDSTKSDPLRRAEALVAEAGNAGVPLRLVGGLAVRALCPEEFPVRVADAQDLDFACTSKGAAGLDAVLRSQGLEPDAQFNAIHGRRQLRFAAADGSLSVDVMLDRFSMSHELDFSDRLLRCPLTLDPTDLLLSKLQIVELNAKDLHDIVHLLAARPVVEGDDPEGISLDRFGEVVRGDWGWWRTVTGNLDRVAGDVRLAGELPASAPHDPVAQARRLREHADEVPKTMGWRMRAKVGERVRWYELPEEVEEA
jgi:hypothetical protein